MRRAILILVLAAALVTAGSVYWLTRESPAPPAGIGQVTTGATFNVNPVAAAAAR